MRITRRVFLLSVMVGVSLVAGGGRVVAACDNLTITVTGKAEGKPDTMYIMLSAEATAGNAVDALQQCKQKADAATQAINDLKIANTTVVREMYLFASPASGTPYGMSSATTVPTGTKVSQLLKVKVKLGKSFEQAQLATTVSRVLDAANKKGVGFKARSRWQAQMSGQKVVTPVTYVLEDATELNKKALANALDKANDTRETLETLGIKMGSLVKLGYVNASSAQTTVFWQAASKDKSLEADKSAVSSSPKEVTVSCSLTLAYKIGTTSK